MKVSFVICSSGERVSFLDEFVLPSIAEQAPDEWEAVIVGRYAGRHTADRRVTTVAAPVGTELFFKPFQQGVEAARHDWIVDLDDDMVLEPGWGDALAAARPGDSVMLGFAMRNPDGSHYGDFFDAIDNELSGADRGETTYFSSYAAPRDLFARVPYPTYTSGDRVHVLRLAAAGIEVEKRLVDGAFVMHAGSSASHPGLVPKTSGTNLDRFRALRKALRKHDAAWVPFADRYLDNAPDRTFADALELASRPDPELASTGTWLR